MTIPQCLMNWPDLFVSGCTAGGLPIRAGPKQLCVMVLSDRLYVGSHGGMSKSGITGSSSILEASDLPAVALLGPGAALTKATTPASPGAAPWLNAKYDTKTHCAAAEPGHGTSLKDGLPKELEPPSVLGFSSVIWGFSSGLGL